MATEAATTAQMVPLEAPTPTSKPTPAPPLTEEQQQKYDWVLEQIKGWKEVPSTKDKAGPLTDNERFWLTRECILRYLRATKWNQKEAEKRILGSLTWRRDYGVEELTADHLSPENETGKQLLAGYDKEGRPCHYLNPGRQNTDPSPRQVQHVVFMLERCIELMPPQQEKLALLINFKASKSRSNTAPGIGLAREVLNILQTHYPERLGRALIINVPWIVQGFFKLITPFIDPLTREKLKFNDDMRQYVPEEQLTTEFNGKMEFDYDHSIYWPALNNMCTARREARKQRWVAGGQQIGELEDYITGLAPVGVAGNTTAKTESPAPVAVVSPQAAPVATNEATTAPASNGADQALAAHTEKLAIVNEGKEESEDGKAPAAVPAATA